MRFACLPAVLPALLCVQLLAGCTIWPDRAAGGMAEHRPDIAPVADGTAVTGATGPAVAGGDAGVEPTRLTCDLQRMAALADAASRRGRLGGQVMLAQWTSFRALRESQAGLTADSERTLDALEPEMNRLSAELLPSYAAPAGCPA